MIEYIIHHPLYLFFIFGIFICGLILLFYTSFVKLRRKGCERISTISSELEQEKITSKKLKTIPLDIDQIELETQQKFLSVRTTILNIHHALWEILS